MLEGPGHEHTRMELHLLHGVKPGKIAGILGTLSAVDTTTDALFSVQGFAGVCVLFSEAVPSFETGTGTSGSELFDAAGIIANMVELLVLGSDKELDTVDTAFDTKVDCGSSVL